MTESEQLDRALTLLEKAVAKAERLERELAEARKAHEEWVRAHQADTDAAWRKVNEAERQNAALERAVVSLIGLFDPYGRGRVNECEDECADRIARARELISPPSQDTAREGELCLWQCVHRECIEAWHCRKLPSHDGESSR